MPSVHLSPIGNWFNSLSTNLRLLAGGSLYTYAAGTTTPQATYTNSIGTVPNANPITLIADGRVPSEIWLTDGQAYLFQLRDALGNLIASYDNISATSDPTQIYTALASTTAPTGSSLVGYKGTLTGSIGRTVQSKLQDRVSVFDYMTTAQITDVTARTAALDVTAPCQAAIDSMPATGGTIFFPQGIYRLTAALNLRSGVFLEGESMRGTQINAPNALFCILITANVRCGVSKMFLNGAGLGYGIYISLVSTQVTLLDVWHESCKVGLQINDSYFIGLYNCSFQSCDISIAGQIGANNVTLLACQLNNGSNAAATGIDIQAECGGWFVGATSVEGFQPVLLRGAIHGITMAGDLFENVTGTNTNDAIVIGDFSGSPVIPTGVVITGNDFNGQNLLNGIHLKGCYGLKANGNSFNNKSFAFKIQMFDTPKRAIDLSDNDYNLGLLGYDPTKIITYDGAYGDSLVCNVIGDSFGFSLHGINGVPTAALENGDAALFQTNAAPAAGLVANQTYLATKTAGVVTNNIIPRFLSGTVAWNPPSIADGDNATTTIPVTGAALGDICIASFSLDVQGMSLSGYVNAVNQAAVVLNNNTGGAIDLANGTVKVMVFK